MNTRKLGEAVAAVIMLCILAVIVAATIWVIAALLG